jgi:hypothetical protein
MDQGPQVYWLIAITYGTLIKQRWFVYLFIYHIYDPTWSLAISSRKARLLRKSIDPSIGLDSGNWATSC